MEPLINTMTEFDNFMDSVRECISHFNTPRRAFLRRTLEESCPNLFVMKDLGYCFDELPYGDARNLVDCLIYFFHCFGTDGDTHFTETELRRFYFILAGQARQHHQLYRGLLNSLRSLLRRLAAHRLGQTFMDVLTDDETDYDSE